MTPRAIAKNRRAGAGVPMGRSRRSSLAAILGSSMWLVAVEDLGDLA